MSSRYVPVSWNLSKFVYDAVLLTAVVGYILIYLGPGQSAVASVGDPAIQRIRAFGSCAFLLLSLILCIGPAARLDRRFLPLLYNRRHFGVITCAIALAHVSFVLDWYFAFSAIDPYSASLASNTSYRHALGFPFEAFGIAALLIVTVLAFTSHDFWLKFLTPPGWKALHMTIYAAYAAVIGHVAFGALQDPDKSRASMTLFIAPGLLVCALHVLAAARTRAESAPVVETSFVSDQWIEIGRPDDIPEKRAKVVALADGREVAIFRYDGKLSAVTNACAHQNGPLGEGRILDGCITCPWHGYQYRPDDGCAPPPFNEKIATYRLKLDKGVIWLDGVANAAGAYVAPTVIGDRDR